MRLDITRINWVAVQEFPERTALISKSREWLSRGAPSTARGSIIVCTGTVLYPAQAISWCNAHRDLFNKQRQQTSIQPATCHKRSKIYSHKHARPRKSLP